MIGTLVRVVLMGKNRFLFVEWDKFGMIEFLTLESWWLFDGLM